MEEAAGGTAVMRQVVAAEDGVDLKSIWPEPCRVHRAVGQQAHVWGSCPPMEQALLFSGDGPIVTAVPRGELVLWD